MTITSATVTALTFDNELTDTDAFHSTSSNTSRITIPAGLGGKYLIYGTLNLTGGSGGYDTYGMIRKNGSDLTNGVSAVWDGNSAPETAGMSTSIILDLVAGDYVELYAWQNSGVNMTCRDDRGFGCVYLGA